MSLLRTAAGAALALAIAAPTVSAQVIGPNYPAPGGTTAVSNGSNANFNPGRVVRYSGFNNSQFSELYWTYQSVANPWMNNNAHSDMSFDHYNAATGISYWTSTQPLSFFSPVSGSVSFSSYLEVQFQPYNLSVNSLMNAGWLTPTTAGSAGIPGLDANQSVVDDPTGANFQVWSEYFADNGQSLGDRYNAYNHNGNDSFHTSSDGEFYTEAATPEPASLVLLGTGLLGIGAVARRRRNRAA